MSFTTFASDDSAIAVAADAAAPLALDDATLAHAVVGLGRFGWQADVSVSPEHFDAIAEQAMRTNWIPRNPRKIESPADVRDILLLAA